MDLQQELTKALADPDIMNKVSSVLSSLGNGENNPADMQPSENAPATPFSIPKIPQDDRTRLLMAIKPFLSEKRAPYMDTAVTILGLLKMGKLGKDLNLF